MDQPKKKKEKQTKTKSTKSTKKTKQRKTMKFLQVDKNNAKKSPIKKQNRKKTKSRTRKKNLLRKFFWFSFFFVGSFVQYFILQCCDPIVCDHSFELRYSNVEPVCFCLCNIVLKVTSSSFTEKYKYSCKRCSYYVFLSSSSSFFTFPFFLLSY